MNKLVVLLFLTFSIFAQPPRGGPPGNGNPPRGGTVPGIGGPPPGNPLTPPVAPIGNPSSDDKIMLGKVLFWDEQLSSTKTVACASCHILSNGGTDPRAYSGNSNAVNPGYDGIFATIDDVIASPGVPQSDESGQYVYNEFYSYKAQVTDRKAPSVINVSYATDLFWDGRAGDQLIDPDTNQIVLASGAALESQVLGPLLSTTEMAHVGRNWKDVIYSLETSSPMALSPLLTEDMKLWIGDQDYYQLFEKAFGNTDIKATKIAMAIAAYERSLYADEAPLNLDLSGDQNALNAQEKRGLGVFRRALCGGCHVGPLLSDNQFHNIGLISNEEDEGRFVITGLLPDKGRFKTPSLNNLANRTAFMHTGQFSTLEEVVDFYDRGGDFNNPNLDPRMVALNLSVQDKQDLVVFLRDGLTDIRVSNETGPFSQPQLYSDSVNMPIVSGFGVAGFDSIIPVISCIEPPILGNSNFTIVLENAKANTLATLIIDTQDPEDDFIKITGNRIIMTAITQANNEENNSQAHASIAITLPSENQFDNTTFYARWYIDDEDATGGMAISPLLEFTLFKAEYGQAGLIFRESF